MPRNNNISHIVRPTVIGFVLICALFLFVGVASLVEMHSLVSLSSKIYKHPLEVSNAALRASLSVVRMHRSMKDVVLADEQYPLDKAIRIVDEEEKLVIQELDLIEEKILGEEGQTLAKETRKLFVNWKPIRKEVIGLVEAGDINSAARITKMKGADHELFLEQKMLSLTTYARKKADGFIEQADQAKNRIFFTISISVALGFIISILIAFYIVQKTKKSLALREKVEKKLQETTDVINMSPVAAFLWKNAEGWPAEYASDRVKDIFGYTPEEFLKGKILFIDVIHPDDLNRVVEEVSRYSCVEGKKDFIHEPYRIVTRNGTIKWVDDRTNIVRNKNNEIINYQGVVVDITERMQAEEDKVKLESRLRQAQKMEAIGTLAGGIAHDFNNILSAIYGYAQLAQMNIDKPEKQKESLAGVCQAADRAKNLVKQILTFSRQNKQEKLPLSISNLAKEVVTMLRQTVPSTIDIRHEISSCGTILADPTQMHQVLMNLCTNAYHSMREEGKGTLRIRVIDQELGKAKTLWGNTVPPGKYILICVSDSGTGMDGSTMKKIFDPFFTTKTVGDGTGLGLAVAHGIVADHQGYTLVDSKLGIGTTFRVYLPVSDKKDTKAMSESIPAYGLHGSERILFVDDEGDMQKIAGTVFRKYGYQITVFGDPMEALAHFRGASNQFDLLITDMTMPKMTGMELIREVLEIRPGLPVVLCTGYSNLINSEDAHKLGITNFVQKPFTMSKLLNITRRAMRPLEQ